jgi:HK97 family phage prohead protease
MEIIKRAYRLEPRDYEGYEGNEHEGKEAPQDIYTFVVSTPEIDRYGTVIVPSGIDYTAYLNNPIVLAQHEADEWPIGKCLGFAMNGENLEATLQIHRITDEACEVADLVRNGYVNAVSVGIIPTEWEEKNVDGETVTFYTKSELVEFSIVSIPANRQALLKKSYERKNKKRNLETIFNKAKKVNRMLTPEQTTALSEQFMPVLIEAATTFLRDELGIAEADAIKAAEAGAMAAGDAMLAVLNGDAPEVAPEVVEPVTAEPMPTENEPATVAASYQNRAGKKISATTYGMISEGLQMINEGNKKISYAIAQDRGFEIKPAKKLTNDELLNLI